MTVVALESSSLRLHGNDISRADIFNLMGGQALFLHLKSQLFSSYKCGDCVVCVPQLVSWLCVSCPRV